MHAESQLLEDPPLGLDHMVLQFDVGGVQNHGLDGPEKWGGREEGGRV